MTLYLRKNSVLTQGYDETSNMDMNGSNNSTHMDKTTSPNSPHVESQPFCEWCLSWPGPQRCGWEWESCWSTPAACVGSPGPAHICGWSAALMTLGSWWRSGWRTSGQCASQRSERWGWVKGRKSDMLGRLNEMVTAYLFVYSNSYAQLIDTILISNLEKKNYAECKGGLSMQLTECNTLFLTGSFLDT